MVGSREVRMNKLWSPPPKTSTSSWGNSHGKWCLQGNLVHVKKRCVTSEVSELKGRQSKMCRGLEIAAWGIWDSERWRISLKDTELLRDRAWTDIQVVSAPKPRALHCPSVIWFPQCHSQLLLGRSHIPPSAWIILCRQDSASVTLLYRRVTSLQTEAHFPCPELPEELGLISPAATAGVDGIAMK